MEPFIHLHVHTQFSLLDGQASIDALIEKAQHDGMKALAVTDHGNMFGIKDFLNKVKKKNSKHLGIVKDCEKELQQLLGKANTTEEEDERIKKLSKKIHGEKEHLFKPIIGCECYCARNGRHSKAGKEDLSGWHLLLLAKTLKGYKNLIKMVSYSWTEGFYGRPRIDKGLLEIYHEDIIACSACLAGEAPRYIQNGDMQKAEETVLWFKNLFGDDYYLELQRHETHDPDAAQDVYPRQVEVNKALIEIARKHNIKLIATNDVHFVNEKDAAAHEILLCLSTNKTINDPSRMRYTRQEWLKTTAEMNVIFSDIPEALSNTLEIADKVEFYDIDSPALMPFFEIDASFGTEDEYREKYEEKDLVAEFGEKNYLRLGGYEKAIRIKLEADYLAYITREKSRDRYGDNLSDEIKERIEFELNTMKTMGFPGYFLIVQDFISAAREMGVAVGPGRGSAAGSVVAYCLGITDIDPIEYDLLFERFLNPDRISMPDIDIDFDDDGRGDVLKWVTDKYGYDRVAHIITYGTMASKMAIKDVARVLELPLSESNRLAKLVPDRMPEIDGQSVKLNLANCLKYLPEFKAELGRGNPLIKKTLEFACQLEGTVRNTGVHACGIIIGRQDISDIVPVSTADDKETGETLLVTQYEGSVIEDTGLIKMDFLGLKTLSIIKEAIENVKQTTGVEIDIDHIDIEDKKTYQLYCQGKTTATFQFESAGMQKYLKELQPSKFEDLIAMNALYRPGPMDYIPSFIARKRGRSEIVYDIPVMERYLKDTYGITVYQEQVMLLSRLLAGFTRGESDTLRKAMGKKQKDKMEELKEKFFTGGEANGYKRKTLEKIWGDWEKFASYAFNKSHATCYSRVAYQTAYLKAHYPSEYMAAVLSRNLSNIKEITKSMDECRAMGLQVLGPDVNESHRKFGVNKKGDIRFGLVAVKGVGEGAVQNIIDEREKNGPYKDIYDFIERINLAACNKKVLESLALSGAFDNLGVRREPFVTPNEKGETFTEIISRYGTKFQVDKQMATHSLFGADAAVDIAKPDVFKCEEWSDLERLNKEKDLIGIYLSAHPLDAYHVILTFVCNTGMAEINEREELRNKELLLGGIVTGFREGTTKRGSPYGILTVEDFTGSGEIPLFGNDYINYGKFGRLGMYLFIRAAVEPRSAHIGALDFKIKMITLLQNEKDKLIEKLRILLPVSELTATLVEEFRVLFKNNPGKTALHFDIIDDEQRNVSVNMYSKTHGIEVTQKLIDMLGDMENVHYKIN
ncbi:MAG: DNA polymerase III subunit alpha [Tannerella sp.]|jgi:DNA polymerase-3 subunit alpha|nr:DNA polymerase III subunit alpha [Tannerella sp.]